MRKSLDEAMKTAKENASQDFLDFAERTRQGIREALNDESRTVPISAVEVGVFAQLLIEHYEMTKAMSAALNVIEAAGGVPQGSAWKHEAVAMPALERYAEVMNALTSRLCGIDEEETNRKIAEEAERLEKIYKEKDQMEKLMKFESEGESH